MKYIVGDLIELAKKGQFDVIAHGCNCFHTMGAGLARQIRFKFPQAFEADKQTSCGDKSKLGSCSVAQIENLTVVNCYTQYSTKGPQPRTKYSAVRACMRFLAQNYADMRIGLPAIGAGLGGADIEQIKQIIEEELAGCDVTMVFLK